MRHKIKVELIFFLYMILLAAQAPPGLFKLCHKEKAACNKKERNSKAKYAVQNVPAGRQAKDRFYMAVYGNNAQHKKEF